MSCPGQPSTYACEILDVKTMVAKRSDHDNETCNIVSLLGRGTKESTMGAERLARKLTAILYADVTGY